MKLVRTLSMLVALAGASTVHADSKPAEKKPAKQEMTAAEAKKAEAFFNDLFNAVVKNQDTCPKMGPAINGVLDKHLPEVEKLEGKEPPQSFKDRMQAKQGELMGAMIKCKDDKGVQDAMQRLASVATKKKSKAEAAPPPAPPAKK